MHGSTFEDLGSSHAYELVYFFMIFITSEGSLWEANPRCSHAYEPAHFFMIFIISGDRFGELILDAPMLRNRPTFS